MSSTSTASVSPGSAPSIAIGPASGYTRSQSSRLMSAVVDDGVIWLSLTSRVCTTTVSPDSTVRTGSLPASHVKWTWSSGK
jgi:hypothetical protein